MKTLDRRAFVKDVGAGMLLAGFGPALFRDLGLIAPRLQDDGDRLDCGVLEPLVRMMQETPPDRILAACVEKLRAGVALEALAGAAALANARTFGGEDYTGYHCEMALAPAFEMTQQVPDRRLASLPLLKVIHRNATRIQQLGGREREVLRRVAPGPAGADAAALVAAEREGNAPAAESAFAAIGARSRDEAFEALQGLVREDPDVHQVVLSWRAFDLARLVGPENALLLLRQSVRFCVARERRRLDDKRAPSAMRELVPRLLDEHRLAAGPPAESRPAPSDAAVDALAWAIAGGTQEGAARAVATALRSGFGPTAAGEAIALAATRLLLHDPGLSSDAQGKPKGSVHGASVGVHASDAANAWRHIAAITQPKTAAATLVAAAWHTGGQGRQVDPSKPFHADARERASQVAAPALATKLDEAIRARDQALAAALAERSVTLGADLAPVRTTLFAHMLEADGALHHEKFLRTSQEELAASRPAFRPEFLAALARVAASGFGFEAPGLAEARERLLA